MPMIDKKKAMTAGATLCIAAAAGYFMQNGAPLPGGAPLGAPKLVSATIEPSSVPDTPSIDVPLAAPLPEGAPEVARADTAPLLMTPPAPVLPFADPISTEPGVELALAEEVPAADDLAVAPAADCDVGFTAASAPAAMVVLTLEAPCHAGEVVEISHAGLRIHEQLDDAGLVRVKLPAMAEEAVFEASFINGSSAKAEQFVPTLSQYERIALVWKGTTGMGLHALEGGATYGDPGHIHANNEARPEDAMADRGGFISIAGSVPGGWTTDIYTYPLALIDAGHSPEISVEAEILADACDSATSATLLRQSPRDGFSTLDLSFGAPGCDAVGEFMVLKNLPQDLKLASN